MGLDMKGIVGAARRWWLLLLLVPLATGAIGYGVGMLRTPMYASSATLLVSISSSTSLDEYNANLLAEDLAITYQTLVETDPVLQPVAASVNPSTSVEALREDTSVTASTGALFTITVVDADPDRAATLVNSIAAELTQFIEGLSRTENGEYPGTVTTVVQGEAPAEPYAPRLPAYVALGVIAGMLVASAGVFLFERSDLRLRAHTDLPALTGLTSMIRLPVLKERPADPAAIFIDNATEPLAGESIRTLRTDVLSMAPTGATLVVASPDPGDGKTLISANLAAAIAHTGKLVMLVDGNLRQPRLHTLFGLDNGQGLSALLADPERPWTSAAMRVAPNLAVIPAGSPVGNPSDLLMSAAFGKILDDILTLADMVIIDTPAIGKTNDATATATHATNVILVARTGKTRSPDLGNARCAFEQMGAPVLGVVINRGGGYRRNGKRQWPAFWRRSPRQHEPAAGGDAIYQLDATRAPRAG